MCTKLYQTIGLCVAPGKKRHRADSPQNHQTNGIGFITAVTLSSANPTHYLLQLLEATTGTTVTNSGSARPSAHCKCTTNQHYNSNIGL